MMAHFVIDAGLWRMRDPLARAFLTTHLPFLRPERSQEHQVGPETMTRLPIHRQPI